MQTIRESIPVEELLKLYMTETIEDAIEVHEKDEIVSQEPIIENQNNQVGGSAAGTMTNPSYEESEKISKEEKEKLEMIKAASSSISESESNASSSGNTNVSFNMDNNEVIPIPPNENKHSSNDDDDDYDIDDDDDDDYSENVKLKIGDNVELSVDAFPADSDSVSGLGSDGGDSDVELTIDEIPMIDTY